MAACHAGTLDPANCCKVACTPDEGRGRSFTKSMQKRNCIKKKKPSLFNKRISGGNGGVKEIARVIIEVLVLTFIVAYSLNFA